VIGCVAAYACVSVCICNAACACDTGVSNIERDNNGVGVVGIDCIIGDVRGVWNRRGASEIRTGVWVGIGMGIGIGVILILRPVIGIGDDADVAVALNGFAVDKVWTTGACICV